MKKALILLLFLVSFSILAVESKPKFNKKKLSKKIPDIPSKPQIEIEFHPKEYYDDLVEKGLRADNLAKGHPPYPFYGKMNYTEDKRRRREILKDFKKKENLRKLSQDKQALEDLGFIGLVQDKSSTNSSRIMKFITNNIRKDDSKFILYPYPFEYLDNNEEEPVNKTVNEGGVFTLNQTALKGQSFQYLQNISSVQIGKAKGIYDIDIAILSMVYIKSGMEVDLFTEASSFCNYFVNSISKTTTCLDGKNPYLEYKQQNPNKGAVVRVSHKDILNETLYDPRTNQLKFKLLIVPDYLSGNENTIFSSNYLTNDAIDVIKKFRDLGGNIITSGKSGYLLEKMGLVPSGTYDKDFILQTSSEKGQNTIAGCEEIYKNSPEEQSDFLKQLICIGYKTRTVLSQTFKVQNVPDTFESLIKYTNKELKLNYKKDGYQNDITNKDETFEYILVSKDATKGRIFLVNGNPIGNSYYFENVRNMILYSMTRNFIYDLKIKFSSGESSEDEDLPIPAGEEGVQLQVNYKFYNLYDTPITNFKLEILFANKIKIVDVPTECRLNTEQDTKYEEMNLEDFNLDQYLICEVSSIEQLNFLGNKFKLEITDFTVTQKLIDIPLMHSYLTFKMGTEEIELIPGIFYAQAAIAALLRGTINKDPTSLYPMHGKGLYFDLVLNVENKENTVAKDVNFIALIPLVTPLVDGEDEGKVAQVVPVFEKYYKKHNFIYPWRTIEGRVRDIDYIDYAEVAGKNVCYVDDFDTPVKYSRSQRTNESVVYPNKFILPSESVILDEKAGALKGISPHTLLREMHFNDSEKFYETAAPRKSLFINTATVEGAKAYYGDDPIPDDEKDADNPNITKVHLAFIRVDTYFYTSIFNQYQLPSGFDGDILISIDKFEQAGTEQTGKILGEIQTKIRDKGHYNSSEQPYHTLEPNQYYNAMRQYANMKQYDPTNETELEALQNRTNDTIKLSHLMVPNKDPLVRRAGNIYGFQENEDHSGFLIQYPSVKFVFGHSVELLLPPEMTRLGGYVEIELPPEVRFNEEDPVEKDRITTSADNVAFYLSEYDHTNGIVKLYFRRGLMPNENYGLPSKCEAYLENLNTNQDIIVNLKIYELKYDFSVESLESYYLIDSATKDITAEYKSFYSFPCLHLENKLSRKSSFAEEESKDMYEYEIMNPFARYGGYFQELTKHTTVFGSAEAHHRTDPGFQGISGGFSIISNIGTSSIPFAEFLNHGTLSIPGVSSTSRLEWSDIWGRKWAQNLRSLYPDIPPIPPAPLNYIMTTTFELITDTKNPKDQERVIEWQSDEKVYIRVQMKMRNTYQLYWEPTICLNNQRPIIKEDNCDTRNPIFIDDETVETVDASIGDDWDVNLGFSSVYGVCYNKDSYLNGTKLNDQIVEDMKAMMTCAATLDAEALDNCSKWADERGLPIIKKRPDSINDTTDPTPDDTWNFSPLIRDYYPDGYISSGMWQLTLDDYYDDQFYKGYPWHLDDCIPNLDNSIIKPHDIIAFPIFKGLGYNMTYDRNYSLYKFPEYKGWWSDQLQNKDHSLIAGQQKVSQVSVGQESLLKDSDWISGYKLKQKEGQRKVIDDRFKNLYVCMFNRHRVKVTPGQGKYAFLGNVYINNVVPILPDLKEHDSRYTQYPCSENDYQYSIYNISQVDNRVYTGNDRDWLYFASGLRGNAMEDINVIMKLEPIESSKFEGITKVQDGGRFTYWQPPDGPNSYQYYDGNVNTVISKRVDLTILGKVLPTTINTFNTYLYELFDINDEKETNRTYTLNTYMNSHGYGDATVSIYVGGVDATSCRVEPGTFTYVKIVFYNNAGFDWKMKPEAITLNDTAYKVYLNAMNIMKGLVTAVQYPSEYKFMKPEIPPEIQPYVSLTPSQHVMDVSPQFFDLTFNNILNIRDALEGDYFYCLNVSENFPDELKGKLWEIKLTLDEEMFESLPPNKNDPTGIHDYHLTIPSIRFGVPISEGENKGKIFYNLGQAKDMVYTFRLYNEFEIKGIKLVNEDIITKLGIAAEDKEEKFSKLLQVWTQIPDSENIINKITISSVPDADKFYNLFTVNLTEAFPLFPYEEAANKPFVSRLYLLIQSYSAHSPYGYKSLMTSTRITYNDGRKEKRASASPSYLTVYSEGPHLAPKFEDKIVELNETSLEFVVANNQNIYDGDLLTIKLTLIASNEGTATAYNAKFNLNINKDAEYLARNQTTRAITVTEGQVQGDEKLIQVFYKGQIEAGGEIKCDLYFKIQFGEKKETTNASRRRALADTGNKVKLVNQLNMSLCLGEILCQEGDPEFGLQKSDVTHSISFKKNIIREIGRLSLDATNIGNETYPVYKLQASISTIDTNYNLTKIVYIFYRKIEGYDNDYLMIYNGSNPFFIDEPFANLKEAGNYKVSYKVVGQLPDERTISSLNNENFYEDEVKVKLIERDIEDIEDLEEEKESDEEKAKEKEKEKKKGFPAYAIALIVVLGIAALVGAGFLAYKILSKKAVETAAMVISENPETIKPYAGDQGFEKVAPSSPRGKRKRNIQNKSVITVDNPNQ